MGWSFCGRCAWVDPAVNVLVTGATGFVGRYFVADLLRRGCRVRAVGRSAETASSMPWINDVEFVAADVHETLDITSLVDGIEVLAHLAWPGLPNYQQLFHFERNLMADYRFIKSAVDSGIQQVLVTGTCFEYGLQNGLLAEQIVPQPSNAYALAKNTLRVFLENLQREQPFVLQWARLFYLYGAGQNPNSLIAALDRALEAGESSFNMSGGEQLRDYLPIETAAAYLADILHSREFDGIVNCCSGQPISVRSLVEQYIQARGASIRLNLGYYPYPKHEAMAFWGSAERLRQIVGVDDET